MINIQGEKWVVVTPWHSASQISEFRDRWNAKDNEVLLIHDSTQQGCALTKNRGIELAMSQDADGVVILDDDCFPIDLATSLTELMEQHRAALDPIAVPMFADTLVPQSRGTPWHTRTLTLPVAASMGFWTGVPDFDAVGQLAYTGRHGGLRPCSVEFRRRPMYQQYFALCGMNLAFRPRDWWPWCQFYNVPRFDDIWMGYLWQKHAYASHHCFNLSGPLVHHSRQSNVWKNLVQEARYMELNETLWQTIHLHPTTDYASSVSLVATEMSECEHQRTR